MTNINLVHAMGKIDPKLIADAAPDMLQNKSAKNTWIKWFSLAACLCLVIVCTFRISFRFGATDVYRHGIQYEIDNVFDLPAQYNGKILVQNLNLSKAATFEFFYNENGAVTNPDDWYSLIISDHQNDKQLLIHCMFGNTTVEDWKVDMVFTNEATKIININGIEIQIAQFKKSIDYNYWYYAIFEYDNIVYDVRVKSNNEDCIYDVLNEIIISSNN